MFLFHVLYRAPLLRKRYLKSKKPDKIVPNKKYMQYQSLSSFALSEFVCVMIHDKV